MYKRKKFSEDASSSKDDENPISIFFHLLETGSIYFFIQDNFFKENEILWVKGPLQVREHVCMHAKSLQSCLTLQTVDCSPQALLSMGASPGKNTGVGCYALLQGIFPTQGLNRCLLCLLQWQVGSLDLKITKTALLRYTRQIKLWNIWSMHCGGLIYNYIVKEVPLSS